MFIRVAAGALVMHSVPYVLPKAQEAASPGPPRALGFLLSSIVAESTCGSLEGNRPLCASPRAVQRTLQMLFVTKLALLVPRKKLQFESFPFEEKNK